MTTKDAFLLFGQHIKNHDLESMNKMYEQGFDIALAMKYHVEEVESHYRQPYASVAESSYIYFAIKHGCPVEILRFLAVFDSCEGKNQTFNEWIDLACQKKNNEATIKYLATELDQVVSFNPWWSMHYIEFLVKECGAKIDILVEVCELYGSKGHEFITLDYIKKLIDLGADVNHVNIFKDSSLCITESEDVLKLLLDNGATPDYQKIKGAKAQFIRDYLDIPHCKHLLITSN